MSASDKKKLRAAERAEKLAERQQVEQKEAKKLKIMTTVFVVVLAAMVVFAAVVGVTKTIEGKGIREKNTVALTVGDHEISNAEFNYYFVTAVENFYTNYGTYASLFGLDVTKPLNEQYVDEAQTTTWADDFMTSAIESAKAIYAMNDAAKADGFTLTEEQLAEVDMMMTNMQSTGLLYYGYPDLETYLKAMYGNGATEESFRNYLTMSYIAEEYMAAYNDNLVFDEAAIRAADAENPKTYNTYSFNSYYLNGANFESLEAAEEAAKTLTAKEIDTVEALDAAIAGLSVNAESTSAFSSSNEDIFFNNVSATYKDWVTADSRKAGDITYVPYIYTSTDENGTETSETRGYYVVLFNGSNDNKSGMSNVRHILVAFEGGTYDSTTGMTTYSDEEKLTAKMEAEKIYEEWKNGKANEASFAVLADEKSDDGDGTTGGLYEAINPSTNFVTNFKNWALAEHKVGDTEIIETEYGYHIMFFSGVTEQTYRDFMIETDLVSNATSEWYTALLEATPSELVDTQYIRTDLVLSAN